MGRIAGFGGLLGRLFAVCADLQRRGSGHVASRFRVVVDGVVEPSPVSVAAGENQEVLLASGLSAAAHIVTLWSITDPIALAWPYVPNGSTLVSHFATDAGAFAASPALPQRRLRIIGDSITAGNQISNITCEDDHFYSYGAKLCSFFNADCQTQAISGKGLYHNCCDGNKTMVELATLTLPGDAATTWDDALFVPDGIVLVSAAARGGGSVLELHGARRPRRAAAAARLSHL